MFYYFKAKDGKSVARISTKPPLPEAKIATMDSRGFVECDHKEFVKLRQHIQKYGSFSVNVPGVSEATA